jgi:23S rRNA pseudouridine2605 synthase
VLGADALRVLRQGVILGGRPTAPAEVEVLSSDAETTTIELVLHEGRNRQVRRMCQAVGHRVLELERTRYATLALDGLAVGQTRELTPGEVEELRAVAGA